MTKTITEIDRGRIFVVISRAFKAEGFSEQEAFLIGDRVVQLLIPKETPQYEAAQQAVALAPPPLRSAGAANEPGRLMKHCAVLNSEFGVPWGYIAMTLFWVTVACMWVMAGKIVFTALSH